MLLGEAVILNEPLVTFHLKKDCWGIFLVFYFAKTILFTTKQQ